jgi:exonuclease SbcC
MATAFSSLDIAVDLGDVAAIARAVDEQRRRVEDWKRAISVHEAAAAAERSALLSLDGLRVEHARVVGELGDAQLRAAQLRTRLDALLIDAVDVTVLDARIERAQSSVHIRTLVDTYTDELATAAQRCQAAVAEHASALARFVSTQAPRLAAALRDGEPCVVCGSRDHPAPARAVDEEPTTFEHVQRLSEACTAADQARQAIEGRLAETRGRLGDDAARQYEELVAEVATLLEQRAAAQRADDERQSLAGAINDVNSVVAALGQAMAGLEARLDAACHEVTRCQGELTSAAMAVDGIDVERVDAAALAVDRLTKMVTDLGRLFDDVLSAAEARRGALERRDVALETSGFDTVGMARVALLDAADESLLRQQAERHRRELADRRAKLEALEEQGIPTERPDDAALQADAEVARAEADDMTIRHTTLRIALDDARGELREHDRLVSEFGGMHQEHLLARRAYKVCSEGGVVNMPLRRWVLAIELDRVANAANVHLQRMTGGRYTVRRRQEVRDGRKAFGLDLEVLDAHTGRTRATSSLSGGEQFQASLALALGLADVVSHGGAASGKRFEALFVDEGFGSLDPSALQDAIAALHQLRATGRMVGVITHVEDMKRDLHVGIEVRRLADGRGSTLIVHR